MSNLSEPDGKQGVAIGPAPTFQQDLPDCGITYEALVGPNQELQPRWKVNDPNNPEGSKPEINLFTWTPDLIVMYSQRYRARAWRCGYSEGTRHAVERPEDMARLQMDWENQMLLSPRAEDEERPSTVELLEQMGLEFLWADEERTRRFEAARVDATQAVGFTPGRFQAPGVPLEAHVQPEYPRGEFDQSYLHIDG